MTSTINSRAVIQARIAEWHRQYRNSDYRWTGLIFNGPQQYAAERVRWFRAA